MSKTDKINCQNCFFGEKSHDGSTDGMFLQCHRYPPQGDGLKNKNKVHETHWCGEWKEKGAA